MKKIIFISAVFLAPLLVIGATVTWTGSGNWSVTTNWSGSAVPVSTDDVLFSASSTNNATQDVSSTINTLTMNSGFTGTLLMAPTSTAGVTLTINGGGFSQSGGTFTMNNFRVSVGGPFSQTGVAIINASGTLMITATSSATLIVSSTLQNLTINDGLVGYWKLDETSLNNSSSVIDYSGYGNTGTATNMASGSGPTSTIPFNTSTNPLVKFNDPRSFNFDGVNDYVRGNMNTVPMGNTVVLWFNANNLTGTYIVFAHDSGATGGGQRMQFNGTSIGFTLGGVADYSLGLPSVSLNSWHFLAVTNTRDGGTATGYLDSTIGSPVTIGTRSGTPNTFTIGGSTGFYFNGLIDDVRIYKSALSAAEINSLYIGNQPATKFANNKQTLGSALTVAGDLTLASGWLDTSSTQSYGITVSGNWYNYGGVFNANNGTVTLNGTGSSQAIQSGGQLFNALTLNGSGGTYFLNDRLYTSSTLTLTAGTLNVATSGAAYTLHAGNISQTGGFFTASSGKLVIDGVVSSTLTVSSSLNNLSLESTKESGLVGYWKFDEGNGTSTRDWSGNNNPLLLGDASTTIPFTTSTVSTTIAFDNPYSLNFDGVNDYASSTTSINSIQTVSFWAYRSSTNASFLALTGTVFVNATGTTVNAGGFTTPTIYIDGVSSTAAATSTWHHIAITTGTAVNATVFNVGIINSTYYSGLIDDLRLYNRALTSGEITNLAAGRYASGQTGATFSLGTTMNVSGTLALDSGQLYTSASNLTANSSTVVTLANGNGQIIGGSGTITFNGGLTLSGGLFNGSSSAITVSSTLTINSPSSTFTATTGNLNLLGNFTNTTGTFAHNNGTVTLSGGSYQTINGSTTFNNLTKSVTTSSTLTFLSGTTSTFTFKGTLTFQGVASNLLYLRSDVAGTQWQIDPQGTRTISYLDVKDSNNVNGTAIATAGFNITNSGNNTGWTFGSTATFGGGASSESGGGGSQQTGGTLGGGAGTASSSGGTPATGGGQGGGGSSSSLLETIGWLFDNFWRWLWQWII